MGRFSVLYVSKAYNMSQMVQCENGVKCPFDWVSLRVVPRSKLMCLSSFITIASDSRRRQKGSGSAPLANRGGRGSVVRPIRSFNTFPIGPLQPSVSLLDMISIYKSGSGLLAAFCNVTQYTYLLHASASSIP